MKPKQRIRITVEVLNPDGMEQLDSLAFNVRAMDSAQVAAREWLGPTTPRYSIDIESAAVIVNIGDTGYNFP
jgi:hypothetical protein